MAIKAKQDSNYSVTVPYLKNLLLTPSVPVGLEGPPGIGKTASIESLARPKDHPDGWFPVYTLSLSLCSSGEVGGILWAQERADNKVYSERALPKWFVDFQEAGRGILFFDELTTAQPAVQHTALRIINEGAIENEKLPPGIIRIVGYNASKHVSSCMDMSPAMANRIRHVHVSPDPGLWHKGVATNWDRPITYSPEQRVALLAMAAFINKSPGSLYQFPDEETKRIGAWPSPRSWFNAAMQWGAEIAAGRTGDDANASIAGIIGPEEATKFWAFRKAMDLPSPEELLANPDSFQPGQRLDITYTALGTVADYIQRHLDEPNGKEIAEKGLKFMCSPHIKHTELKSMFLGNVLPDVVSKNYPIPKEIGNLMGFLRSTKKMSSAVKK